MVTDKSPTDKMKMKNLRANYNSQLIKGLTANKQYLPLLLLLLLLLLLQARTVFKYNFKNELIVNFDRNSLANERNLFWHICFDFCI